VTRKTIMVRRVGPPLRVAHPDWEIAAPGSRLVLETPDEPEGTTKLVDLERDVARLEERQRELEVAGRDLKLQIREVRARNAWATQQLLELARRALP
jgi:hypothetical protein